MKPFLQYLLACCCLLACHLPVKAQNILHLSGNEPFFVRAGTTLSLDSLVLAPSTNLTISSANDLTKNTTVLHPAGNDYVRRVYRFNKPLPAFSGAITLYYLDKEVDYLSENDLTLKVYNGAAWNTYNTGVSRNATANFVATTGLSNLTLLELTLTGSIKPLFSQKVTVPATSPAINPVGEETLSSMVVYPNPATSVINIAAGKGGAIKSIKLYDGGGGLVAASTLYQAAQYALNVSRLTSGRYTLVMVMADGRSLTKAFLKQ